jgi:hypothetical protein
MRILRFLCLLLALTACNGPYEDLSKDFEAHGNARGSEVKVRNIVLVSTKHRGAFSYRGGMSVSLTEDVVEVRPDFPLSLFVESLDLPSSRVSGCAMTCFGVRDQNVDLLFENHGADIQFDAAEEFIDWCWRNDVPMTSGANKRDWLYSGKALPSREVYVRVSKEDYEKQAHRACLGY